MASAAMPQPAIAQLGSSTSTSRNALSPPLHQNERTKATERCSRGCPASEQVFANDTAPSFSAGAALASEAAKNPAIRVKPTRAIVLMTLLPGISGSLCLRRCRKLARTGSVEHIDVSGQDKVTVGPGGHALRLLDYPRAVAREGGRLLGISQCGYGLGVAAPGRRRPRSVEMRGTPLPPSPPIPTSTQPSTPSSKTTSKCGEPSPNSCSPITCQGLYTGARGSEFGAKYLTAAPSCSGKPTDQRLVSRSRSARASGSCAS